MVNPSDLIGFLLGPHLAKWTVSREKVMSPVSWFAEAKIKNRQVWSEYHIINYSLTLIA